MSPARRSARGTKAKKPAHATAHHHHASKSARPEPASAFELCFEKMRPRFEAIEAGAMVPMTHDIPSMVATVLGAVVNIGTLRPAIAALPNTDVACFDELEDCARALIHANMLYQLAMKPSEPVAVMADRAVQLRATLYSDAVALENRELLGGDELTNYRGTPGYKVIAADLVLLAGLLRRAWPAIEGKTAIRESDLADANTIANTLLTAVGVRERAPALIAETSQTRLVAYNLLLQRYDDVRRAISYLRWREDDVDDFAPSLYAGRNNGNHRRRPDDTEAEPASPDATLPAVAAGHDAAALPVPARTAPKPAGSAGGSGVG
jgi:hypothetical protein